MSGPSPNKAVFLQRIEDDLAEKTPHAKVLHEHLRGQRAHDIPRPTVLEDAILDRPLLPCP
jgi:hypothetical protein